MDESSSKGVLVKEMMEGARFRLSKTALDNLVFRRGVLNKL